MGVTPVKVFIQCLNDLAERACIIVAAPEENPIQPGQSVGKHLADADVPEHDWDDELMLLGRELEFA